MEEDEIQAHACKFPRVARNDSNKQIFPEGQEIAELRRRGGGDVPTNRFHSWHHHSSRIIRVSRASGGKDRHSKVMTSKGLRDRRVRLSVTTAIQFYDLQDRLGYDQPSKAVEWLIKAAGDAISELPSLNDTFPPDDNASKQSGHERRGSVGTEQGMGTGEAETQSQNLSWSNKSAGSSTSDQTSKGSGLSLSRSEIRVKARERARERTAKEKEKEKEKENNNNAHSHHNVNNPISQTASFTELLTGGITSTTTTTTCDNEPNLFKGSRQQLWCASATPMDYFNSGHNNNNNNQSCGLPTGQIQYPQGVCVSPLLNVMGENQTDHQLQHFSFIPDHLIPSDYNLNFTISSNSGLAGFNRGTLQSNSPSLITHPLHRFSSPLDASNNLPFFIGAAAAAAAPTMELNHHHHQFSPGFDGRLQLCYGDASRHSDHKTKPKN